jgi:plastocyanin
MRLNRRGQRTAFLAALGFILYFAASAQATDYNISMTADGFVPDYLEVTVGDRVYWWNEDYDFLDYHSSHSYSYPWNSFAIDVNYGVYLDVSKTGTFDYVDDVGYSGTGTLVVKPAGPPPPPPPTLISAPNRVDMVYDAGRDIVYITSGSQVLRYQLASDSFLTPFQLSGSLKGLDISPDGNTLVVADSSATSNVWVHVVNLNSGQSSQVFFPASFYESGTFAVAFGGDGAALISSRFAGSGWVPLRRYDPVSGLKTVVSPSVRHDSMISSSGDGTTIFLAESDSSNGPFSRYDVASRAFARNGGDGWFNYECAVNRDASIFAVPTYGGTFIYNGNFTLITNIGAYAGQQPVGAAFHPAADVVFFPFAGTTFVKAYSTTNWQMLDQYDFQYTFSSPGNHAFDNGRIKTSPDGQIIFVTVSGGVRYLRHGLTVPLTHRLLVSGNPSGYGPVDPVTYGSYWLPHGTNLTISVPEFGQGNGSGAVCRGWVGTGSATGSGAGNSTSFALNSNSTVTWNWAPFVVSGNKQANQINLTWPSLSGKTYDVMFSTNVSSGFLPVAIDLPATPPNNTYPAAIGPARTGFYKVKMK